MKRIAVVFLALSLVAMIFLASCSSEPEEPPQRRDLPQFFINPPIAEDVLYGLGMAKLSNDSLSRDTAVARARKDIAFQVSARVQSMLTDYAQDSGVDGNSQTITFVESITKQVTDIELRGAVTEEVYPAVDGTWYAMVSFPKNAMVDEVQQVFQRNEDAAFAEFKAQQAMDRLNMEMDNNPPKSAGVESPANQ